MTKEEESGSREEEGQRDEEEVGDKEGNEEESEGDTVVQEGR